MEEQIELDLKISELKGASTMNDDCVDKFIVDLQESQLSQQGGLTNGLQMADGAESVQSGRFTGAKRRKSGSVKRFKQEIGSGVPDDCRNRVAVGFDSMANDLHRITRVECSRNICDIIEIIKPVSYSSSITNNIQDISATFTAKRFVV
ncbi:hypothetical protein ACH5RR_023688 [Cinchona calisaya]|uniref:Uncharacterized protein n=1 Tax=Cinchona calisaya TaxID=153742 RepID=A0ABD2ZBD7_9GENT